MTSSEPEPKPAPSQPVVYQIRIKGHLDSQWADWFEGLTITLEENGDTLITGAMVDQAALFGLLRKVRDLGLPLISVNHATANQADRCDDQSYGFCIRSTCGIKACAQHKGYEFCNQCSGLKTCELMLKFISEQQYPYGQCVLKNMETIRDIGLPKWLEVQDARWRCKNCGASHSWYHEACPECGRAVASYKTDLRSTNEPNH